jgi:hypothetical protein
MEVNPAGCELTDGIVLENGWVKLKKSPHRHDVKEHFSIAANLVCFLN